MHPCLSIHEILSTIFEHFSDPSTLVALARTCRAFTEPALDILWQELLTLSPLLQCLASDFWVVQIGKHSGRTELCFCKPLVDADWTRFNYYKSRVRVLGRNTHTRIAWHDVHVQTLRELSLYQPNTPLLPNLHTINFRVLLPNTGSFARLLLGPSVKQVTIPITSEDVDSAVEVFSSLIPHLSPNIRRLDIWSITSLRSPCSAIFQLIQGLHHLHTLNIDLKHCGLHERLGGLSALNSLRLSLIGPGHFQFYTTALGQFPLLTDFSFAVDDWLAAATIMTSMQCRFTDLAVTTYKQRPLSDLQVFMDSLSQHPSLTTLTHLSLADFQTTQGHSDNDTYIENIFRPLFAFSGFKSLNILIDKSASLRDSWYADAAAAWPLLESLSISSSSLGPIKANMTLEGLIPFAKYCINLESVKLRLCAEPFDPTQVNDISNTNIQKLCLEAYTVPSPRHVYLSLIRIFPNLEYVYQGRRFSSGLSWPWDEVNAMLHASSVRRRGPCISKIIGCTCGTPDDKAGPMRVMESRPQTPASSWDLSWII